MRGELTGSGSSPRAQGHAHTCASRVCCARAPIRAGAGATQHTSGPSPSAQSHADVSLRSNSATSARELRPGGTPCSALAARYHVRLPATSCAAGRGSNAGCPASVGANPASGAQVRADIGGGKHAAPCRRSARSHDPCSASLLRAPTYCARPEQPCFTPQPCIRGGSL
jgi:hypothetical protein